MNFGKALELLKQGKLLEREGWNGKGMFLYYVGANSYPVSRNTQSPVKGMFTGDMVPYGEYIAIKNAQGVVNAGWKPTSPDMFAEDWVVVDDRSSEEKAPPIDSNYVDLAN